MGFGPLGTSWALALKILSCFGHGKEDDNDDDDEEEEDDDGLVFVLNVSFSMPCFLVGKKGEAFERLLK